jgi:peptidoglycan/xylan/chitin deacetylase (PgdA/CDA1 family)
MAFKHGAKRFLREAWARTLFHTGAHRLVDRLQPRRLTILAGHCVSAPSNAKLPPDMKIEAAKLERILAWLRRHFEVVTVADGVTRLRADPPRSLVALSMDDGYVDNRTHLLPLLEKLDVSATIYLESEPLDARVPNWSHKLFAVLEHLAPTDFVHRFTELSTDTRSNVLLNQLVPHDQATVYHVKRLLKYEVPAAERGRVLDILVDECKVDARALTQTLYMTWDDARALQSAGIELGAHTVHHEILSRLDAPAARAEIEGSRTALARALGIEPQSFAYPFGRNWDFDEDSARIAREAGFASATTTHAGTNSPRTDPYRLKRVMIDENAQLHLIAAEACGGFDLLRRFGLDLSE